MIAAVRMIHMMIQARSSGMPRTSGSTRLKNGVPTRMPRNGNTASHRTSAIVSPMSRLKVTWAGPSGLLFNTGRDRESLLYGTQARLARSPWGSHGDVDGQEGTTRRGGRGIARCRRGSAWQRGVTDGSADAG